METRRRVAISRHVIFHQRQQRVCSLERVDPFVATLSHARFAAKNRAKRAANWTILTRSRPRPPCTCTAPSRRGKCPRIASPTPWSFSPSCCCCSLCARSQQCSPRDGTAPCPTTPPGEACSATWRILCSPRRKAARLASTARTWSSVSRAAPSFCNTRDLSVACQPDKRTVNPRRDIPFRIECVMRKDRSCPTFISVQPFSFDISYKYRFELVDTSVHYWKYYKFNSRERLKISKIILCARKGLKERSVLLRKKSIF